MDVDANSLIACYVDGSQGLGNNIVTIKNCVLRQSQLSGTSDNNKNLYVGPIDATAATWVMDYNIWQAGASHTWWNIGNDDTYATLAAYQTGWNAIHAGNEAHSLNPAATALLFLAPAGTIQSTDLSLITGTTAAEGLADAGDPHTPATDILGGIRDGSPDAGAYEYPTGPAQFTFTSVADADVLTTYTSLPVTVTGLTGGAAITVMGDASALYSINSATVFTASPGIVVDGDLIRARVTTGAAAGAAYDAVVTVNGMVDTFRVTTAV
jgi:hypothetical protein